MGRNKVEKEGDNNTDICGRRGDNGGEGEGDKEYNGKIIGIFREEEGRMKCRENKDNEVQKGKRENVQKEMDMEGKDYRRGERDQIFGIRDAEERKTGGAGKGYNKEDSKRNGTSMGNRKEKIWRKLG